jgi:hypothetical protein
MLIHRTVQSTKRQGQKCTGQSSCKECSASCAYPCVQEALNSSPKGPDPPSTWPLCSISFGPNAQGPSQISPPASKNLVLCTRGSNHTSPFMCPKRWSPSPSLCLRNPYSSPRGIVNPYVSNAQAKVQEPNPKTRV